MSYAADVRAAFFFLVLLRTTRVPAAWEANCSQRCSEQMSTEGQRAPPTAGTMQGPDCTELPQHLMVQHKHRTGFWRCVLHSPRNTGWTFAELIHTGLAGGIEKKEPSDQPARRDLTPNSTDCNCCNLVLGEPSSKNSKKVCVAKGSKSVLKGWSEWGSKGCSRNKWVCACFLLLTPTLVQAQYTVLGL